MNISAPVLAEGTAILFMTVMLMIEGVAAFFRTKVSVFLSILAVVGAVGAAVAVNSSVYNAPYAYTEYLTKTLSSKIKLEDGDELAQSFTAVGTKLDYVIVKISSAEEGKLLLSVEEKETGAMIAGKEVSLSETGTAYLRIQLEDCDLEPDVQYIIKLRAELKDEDTVKVYRTIDYLDTGNEFFMKNGEILDGAMGIRMYESGY